MIANVSSSQSGQVAGNGMRKVPLLKKSSDGSSYAPWFKELKTSFASHPAPSVQECGVCLVREDDEIWYADCAVRYK